MLLAPQHTIHRARIRILCNVRMAREANHQRVALLRKGFQLHAAEYKRIRDSVMLDARVCQTELWRTV